MGELHAYSVERGVIRNRARAQQIRDFRGLRFDTITPTDIDGLIEYKNKAYVLIELKYGDAEMDTGQKLALERMHADLSRAKPVLTVIAQHWADPPDDIDVANALVVERWRGSHKLPPHYQGETVEAVICDFLDGLGYMSLTDKEAG